MNNLTWILDFRLLKSYFYNPNQVNQMTGKPLNPVHFWNELKQRRVDYWENNKKLPGLKELF